MLARNQFAALREWIMTATNLPDVILGHQSAPRPDGEYGVLQQISAKQLRHACSFTYEANPAYVDENSEVPPYWTVTVREMEWRWQLDAYAKHPLDTLGRCLPWRETQEGREAIEPLNLHRFGSINRIPEQIKGVWVERATMDIFARAYVSAGLESLGGEDILLGRVPVDVIEQTEVVQTMLPGGLTTTVPIQV